MVGTVVYPNPLGPCLQAWLRARGSSNVKTYTADDVVDQFGVVKGSYDAVPLPKIKAYTVGSTYRLAASRAAGSPCGEGVQQGGRCGPATVWGWMGWRVGRVRAWYVGRCLCSGWFEAASQVL